jgi:hypothetical protein
VDRVYSEKAWSSPKPNNNPNPSGISMKQRSYCDYGDVLTWTLHEDAEHPLGSFECKDRDKKRIAICIGKNN